MAGTTLHVSLRSRTNLVLAGLWLAGLAGLIMMQGKVPWLMISLGVVSGAVQGLLQQRALRDGAARFCLARTARDVRAALVSTASGRAQIKVLWGSLPIYLVAAVVGRAITTPGALAAVF